MRRKGHVPFARRGIGAKSNNNLDKSMMGSGSDLRPDSMYYSMQRGLSDGMNHITKSIMNNNGRGGIMSLGGNLGIDGDFVNDRGDLQIPRRENIPLRPLMLNCGKTVDQSNSNNFG